MTIKTNFGRVVALFVAVPTAVLAVLQVIDWWTSPSSHLVAEVSSGEFTVPPSVTDELETLSKTEVLESAVDLNRHLRWHVESADVPEELQAELVKVVVGDLSRFLDTRIDDVIRDLSRIYKGYWSVVVRNDGTEAVESVKIKLPYTVYARIEREDGTVEHGERPEAIVLGEMQPREEIQVFAWTNIPPTPSSWDRRLVELTHSTGIGDVTVQRRVARFWLWMDKWWLFCPLVAALVWLLGMLVWSFMPVSGSPDGEEEPKDAETPATSDATTSE